MARYQYHHMKAYAARGKARMKALEERSKDTVTPDPPRPRAFDTTKHISKNLDYAPDYSGKPSTLSELNPKYCKPCRRIFDGTGDPPLGLLEVETMGAFYAHWDGHYLAKSASRGCPLCVLLHRGLHRARSYLHIGEEVPTRYDIGHYVGNEHLYAIRFYYYSLLENGGKMIPRQMPHITVTMQPADCKFLHTVGWP